MNKRKLEKTIKILLSNFWFDENEETYTVQKEGSGCGSVDGYDISEAIKDKVNGAEIVRYGDFVDARDNSFAEVVFKINK